MKNFEKYIDLICKRTCLRIITNPKVNGCEECNFGNSSGYCDEYKIKKWLLAEYQEQIKLTPFECHLLKGINPQYNLIGRDTETILWVGNNKDYEKLRMFTHLFNSIERGKHYEIAKLIADYEKEHEDE